MHIDFVMCKNHVIYVRNVIFQMTIKRVIKTRISCQRNQIWIETQFLPAFHQAPVYKSAELSSEKKIYKKCKKK